MDTALSLTTLANAGDVFPIGIIVVAMLWLVLATIAKVVQVRSREATKREIAAYIAEGSMTPEEGARLVRADIPHWEKRPRGC